MTHDTPTDAARRPSAIPWPPILFVLALAGAWTMGRASPLPWPGLDDGPAQIIGLGFGVLGVVLIAWAVSTLHRGHTTIMPNQRSDHLVINGPYAFRRNPIYLGEVFMLFGLAELTSNIWFVIAGLLFAVAVTWLAILPEERHLEARFGTAWIDYKEKTRRWI